MDLPKLFLCLAAWALLLSPAAASWLSPSHDEYVQPERHFVLLHMHDSSKWSSPYERIGQCSLDNMYRYANRWGYEVVYSTGKGGVGLLKKDEATGKVVNNTDWERDQGRPVYFAKLLLADAACEGRSPDTWLLWMDADALFVNQSIPLESIVDDAYDVIISKDWVTVNSGVMFIKCSPWGRNFLKRAYSDVKNDNNWSLGPEQAAIIELLDEPASKGHYKYVAKHAINVYPEEYRVGDFIVHLAGKGYGAGFDGVLALCRQFDALAILDSKPHIEAFVNTRFMLHLSGNQFKSKDLKHLKEELPELMLDKPLIEYSTPDRYWHIRRMFPHLHDWYDHYDPEEIAAREGKGSAEGGEKDEL